MVKHFSFSERGRRRIHQTPRRFDPLAILRSRTDEDRLAERHAFTEDLRMVAQSLAS